MRLSRRFTRYDLDVLPPSMMIAQLKHIGFDMDGPVTMHKDSNSVYFQQGEGRVVVEKQEVL